MKTIFALLSVALLTAASHGAAAQEVLAEPSFDSVMPEPTEAADVPSQLDEAAAKGEAPEPIPMGDEELPSDSKGAQAAGDEIISSFDPALTDENANYFGDCAASFESSGSWLRRGYWYSEFDFLLLNRQWDRKGTLLMYETTTATIPTTLPVINQPFFTGNYMLVQGGKPGGQGMGRVTMGRFLFRDRSNRDHLASFTFLSGGDNPQEGLIEAVNRTNGLTQSPITNKGVNRGFNTALSSAYDYTSQLNSLEFNYEVKQRMRRDRLVLQPNGDWVRAASPSKTFSYLAGTRFLSVHERLNWTATDINLGTPAAPNRQDGFSNIQSDNNLLGTQLGLGYAYETARWSLNTGVKGGAYWNSMDVNANHRVGDADNPANEGFTDSRNDNLSFVGEAQFIAKWHLRPNVSIRAGLELLYVEGIALAPHQLTFQPGQYLPISAADDAVYMGSVLGLEWYR